MVYLFGFNTLTRRGDRMKKLFVLLLMLLSLVSVAYADLTPPLDANGEPIVINTLMPYGKGLLIHHNHGEIIYLSDAADNWHAWSAFSNALENRTHKS